MVKTYVLDRPIAGIYVDEAAGMLFGLMSMLTSR